MRPVFEKAGLEFPEEKRRRGLESEATFIIAFDAEPIAGYFDYPRSWNDPDYIYIASIQIDERYRNSPLILMLFDKFRSLLADESFRGFETNVLKTNTAVIRICQKAGFKLEVNPRNELSWLARAGRELLDESPLVTLLDRWRAKQT